ncbi:LamG domain-containing protein [Streptomyces cyaneochromogenes]|uniref:LamG domain-containing protein n=1 Tax=Streptomyces cyaneochromogenes TaxID=2496836 RepID=A0A3Q9ENQ0_9ACTN|nr:LamG domain-containing protein [Streptomyces cyaneochromogenes]AZQ32160.1 LamG domain-containing protein [Streptomyces cyaneochromogenes]
MTGIWARQPGRSRAVGALLGVTLAAGLVPGTVGYAMAGTQTPVTAGTGTTDGPAAAATEAQALANARKSGEAVEVLSQRGETTEVFATPDGNFEAREYLRPTWTRAEDGWKHVNTELAATEGGTVAPKAATVNLEFSGGGAQDPLVRMERAGRTMSLSWPTALPEPQLSGAMATYPDVLPDVDLRMTAQEDGFAQLLVVKSAEAAKNPDLAELRLKLGSDGLEVKENAQGGLRAVDGATNGTVFEAPKPVMWDSSPGESAQAPSVSGKTLTATTATTATSAGEPGAGESGKLAPVGVDLPAGENELVLTPDQSVLNGAGTKYPVFIDPQWYSPRASAWTMASKYWASSPQWRFNGDSDAGLGYCGWYYCQPHDTKRLFYRISTSAFAGRTILEANFVVRNTWSASCSDRTVELWDTDPISDQTTWNSQNATGFWNKQLASDSFAYGYSGCSAADAEFNVKSALQAAANAKDPSMTFGLRAASETDEYAWKRFSDKAFLRVKYNRPPGQIKMSQLTMEYGGTCKAPSSAARVRTLGKIYATGITDPDGDPVSVQFQAKWDGGSWTPGRTGSKASGSSFTISLPTSIPPNKTVNWYVRSHDGAQYSPWSNAGDPTGCYFVYDTQWPKAPSITSGEYPLADLDDPQAPWYDGVGKYGSFTIKAANTDVTKYWYGINKDPSSANTLPTSGGAAEILKVLPSEPGVKFVTAKAIDAAGHQSETYTYHFRVKSGQPERSMWQLDETAGATAATATAKDRPATLYGGPTLGAVGTKDKAVTFDGVDDYAATDIPTVSTDGGFAVSAWAKLSKAPGTAAVIAAQPGNHAPGFELYYSSAYDRWAFNQYTADTASATPVRAMAPAAGGVTVGKWTHLVGTYSSGADEMKLYVDGVLVGTTAYSTPWDARRGLQFGAGSYSGQPGSFFPGDIDEVQIFDKPLSQAEVTVLNGKTSLSTGRPARMVFAMDEQAGAPELTGKQEVVDATYVGGPTAGGEGVAGNALTLDGTNDYATTNRPLLNNERSFAVSAWAKLPAAKPNHAGVVATQLGTNKPGFELYYSSSYDRWVFNNYSADSATGTPIRAMQAEGKTAFGGSWAHLVGVHDTVANKLLLYVNGTLAGSTALSSTWYAGGPVQLGASRHDGSLTSFFPGQIDDVRIFDRAVSGEEVTQLFKQRPLVKSRWTFETTAGTAPVTVPDAAGSGSSLTLNGGAAQSYSAFMDAASMELNGTTAYASTSKVPVDTAGSFTLTAWAVASSMPSGPVSLIGAEGANRNAFTVRFIPDPVDPDRRPGRWQLAVTDTDDPAATPTVVEVDNGLFNDVRLWNHLALAYDGFSKQVRLYVNGDIAELGCADADGNGEADVTGCVDLVPWAENVLAFKATSLQIGRSGTGTAAGSYFPGLVDDVWTFQGALTDAQIEKLSNTWFDLATKVPGD